MTTTAMIAASDAPSTKKNGSVRWKMILVIMMSMIKLMIDAIAITLAVLSSID